MPSRFIYGELRRQTRHTSLFNMFQTGVLPVDKLMSRKINFGDLNEAMDRLDDAKTIREVLIP